MSATGPILLLDAASLYYRAFYGVPDRRRDPQDPPNNAVRGFLDMISTLVATHRPRGLVACWDDDWRPAFRVAAVPSYKTHRLAGGDEAAEETPDALSPQVPVIAAALEAVGLPRVGAPGFEADDVIGTLAERWRATAPVRVVTGDRDLFQLVDDDADVQVLYTARGGVRDAEVVDQAYLAATYGVPTGAAYLDLALLRGDPSDGLPGVAGIGPKTAVTLLERYGSVAGVYAALDDDDVRLKGAQRTRLAQGREYVDRARPVVQVVRDAPVPPLDPALPRRVADVRALSALASGPYRLATPLTRLVQALGLEG